VYSDFGSIQFGIIHIREEAQFSAQVREDLGWWVHSPSPITLHVLFLGIGGPGYLISKL
jgi:hypothetical protein